MTPVTQDETSNIVDRARALIVHTLDEAALKYVPSHGSNQYLAGMARKVKAAEAVAIDSYLVLDCVIAALNTRISSQVGLIEALEEARTCLLDGDDIFPCRAARDDAILEILSTALANARGVKS